MTYIDYYVGTNNLSAIRVVSDGQTQTLTRYTYDTSDRLVQVQVDLSPQDSIADTQVYSTSYTYDGVSRRVASITQSDGSSVAFTYELIDGQYRVRTYTDGEGRVATLTYSQASSGGAAPVIANAASGALSTTDTQTYSLNSGALTTPSGASWSVASLLETSGTTASNPKVAFDSNGNGFAVWAQGGDVVVRRYTAATDTWAAAAVLDSRSETVYAPALAVDSAGNAVVAWVQSDGTASSIYARTFSASGGSWESSAQVLETSAQPVEITAGSVSVAMRAGYAAAGSDRKSVV